MLHESMDTVTYQWIHHHHVHHQHGHNDDKHPKCYHYCHLKQ